MAHARACVRARVCALFCLRACVRACAAAPGSVVTLAYGADVDAMEALQRFPAPPVRAFGTRVPVRVRLALPAALGGPRVTLPVLPTAGCAASPVLTAAMRALAAGVAALAAAAPAAVGKASRSGEGGGDDSCDGGGAALLVDAAGGGAGALPWRLGAPPPAALLAPGALAVDVAVAGALAALSAASSLPGAA
jgi:hypothetical protein